MEDLEDIFQFHIGAIKSKYFRPTEVDLLVFQFHIGAIKRFTEMNFKKTKTNFNSTLVRLKAPMSARSLNISSYFNSTLVRLKVP